MTPQSHAHHSLLNAGNDELQLNFPTTKNQSVNNDYISRCEVEFLLYGMNSWILKEELDKPP